MLNEFHDDVVDAVLDLFVEESIEEGCDFDQGFLSHSPPSNQDMTLIQQDRMTQRQYFFQNRIKINKLEILAISLNLTLIILLYPFIQHIKQPFRITYKLNPLLCRFQ